MSKCIGKEASKTKIQSGLKSVNTIKPMMRTGATMTAVLPNTKWDNGRLLTAQRQQIVAQMGQHQGNRHVQRVLQRQQATAVSPAPNFAQQDQDDWYDVRHQEGKAWLTMALGMTSTRQAILNLARSQIGTVDANNRGDGNKTGWQRILRFYEVAFEGAKVPGGEADWFAANFGDNSTPEAAAQSNKQAVKGMKKFASFAFHGAPPKGETFASMKKKNPKYNPGPWSWCGMFAVWAVKSVTGRGGWANSRAQGLTAIPTAQAQPGDIVHFNDKRQHHAILAKPIQPGDKTLTIIEGNGHYQRIGESSNRRIDEVLHFYQAEPPQAHQPPPNATNSHNQTPPQSHVQKKAQVPQFVRYPPATSQAQSGAATTTVRRKLGSSTVQQKPIVTPIRQHIHHQLALSDIQRQSIYFNSVASEVIAKIQPGPVAGAGDYVGAYKILNGRWLKEMLEILEELKQKGYLGHLVSNLAQAKDIHHARMKLALKVVELNGSVTPDQYKQQFATEFATLNKNPDQQQLLLSHLTPPTPAAAPSGAQPAAKATIGGFSAQEAQQIQQAWTASGSYTVTNTGDQLETQAYMQWRAKAQSAIKKLAANKAKTTQDWIAEFEAHEKWKLHQKGAEPKDPGATPVDLSTAAYSKKSTVGDAPTPAFRHVKKYDVSLPNKQGSYSFRDDPIKKRYKYMKNETGVAKFGKKVSDRTDADQIFKLAGITDPVVIKVMKKVSTHEGGFEAVNTYDTGYISVGFIQFISGKEGKKGNSLVTLLQTFKQSDPTAFKSHFHDMGIDVDQKGLTVVDPATGNVLQGAAAVQAVMNDKRLTAVFHHAGKQSEPFRVAQIKTAYNGYYLADHSFTIKDGQTTISGKYGDVLQSEAGKTAIMDRGVQKGVPGTKKVFATKCKQLMKAHNLTSVADLARYERAIIPAIQNRVDVLNDSKLSQPGLVP